MAILLSLSPNLEELEAVQYEGPLNALLDQDAAAFPHLRRVTINDWKKAGELMFEDLDFLSLHAPNLTYLRCSSMGLVYEPQPHVSFKNVVELRVDRCGITVDGLDGLLQTCPNLRHFYYEAGGQNVCDEQFTPYEAPASFFYYAPDLVSLKMYMARISEYLAPAEIDDLVLLGDLTELTKLENLVLDIQCLIPPQEDPFSFIDGPAPVRVDPMMLVELLPPSIKSIRLVGDIVSGANLGMFRRPLASLAAVAAERFSNLKKVQLVGEVGKGFDGIKLTFETAGVDVVGGDWGF